MKNYTISNVAASEAIAGLATQMHTTFREDYGEYILTLPEDLGKGTITGINFPNGVGFYNFRIKLREATELRYAFTEVHPIKFVYCLGDSITHFFNKVSKEHRIDTNQTAILASNFQNGNRLILGKEADIHIKLLLIDRKKFARQLTFPIEKMEKLYYDIFADTNAIRSVFYYSDYSLRIARLMEEMDTFEERGLARTSFLGAKALELLAYMLLTYKDDHKGEYKRFIIRNAEIERIKAAVKQIDTDPARTDTVKDLAEKAGMNTAKLQEGFKLLFNKTVNEYIQSRRLEEAMRLLCTTDKNVSEVVYAVGLSSRSYFSKIFKLKYGISPSHVVKSIKNTT